MGAPKPTQWPCAGVAEGTCAPLATWACWPSCSSQMKCFCRLTHNPWHHQVGALSQEKPQGRVAAPGGTHPKEDAPQGVVAGALRGSLGQVQLCPSSWALTPCEPASPRSAALAPAPREHGACESSHAVLAPDLTDKSRCLKAG